MRSPEDGIPCKLPDAREGTRMPSRCALLGAILDFRTPIQNAGIRRRLRPATVFEQERFATPTAFQGFGPAGVTARAGVPRETT